MSGRSRPSLPKRPYRDSALLNLFLAAVIIVVSWATGGGLARAFVIATLYFVIATAWAWWRFKQRLEKEES